ARGAIPMIVWRLDRDLDRERYVEMEEHFFEYRTKQNVTNVKVESILEVRLQCRDQFVA
ncbi:hypothetical protein BG005_010346, partial [Podila minutissima]